MKRIEELERKVAELETHLRILYGIASAPYAVLPMDYNSVVKSARECTNIPELDGFFRDNLSNETKEGVN